MPTKVILLSWTSLRVNKSISREKKIKKGSNTGRQVLGKFISREGSYRFLVGRISYWQSTTFFPMTSLREQRESKNEDSEHDKLPRCLSVILKCIKRFAFCDPHDSKLYSKVIFMKMKLLPSQ